MAWDRKIANVRLRFRVLKAFDNEAVLDRETGLIWERSPNKEAVLWPNARLMCAQKAIAGRGGWRLPTFNELTSLVDPSIKKPNAPRLPARHPFVNVQPASYWSATSFAEEPGFALVVNFLYVAGSDAPIEVNDANVSAGLNYAWAVRGGAHGPSIY